MRFVDLSHTIWEGLVTYPGLPAPRITDPLSREASRERDAPGTEFRVAKFELVANTGTYLDAPSHRWADGADLSGLALEQRAELPGVVVDLPSGARAITARDLPSEVRGCAVLLRTGWSAHGRGHLRRARVRRAAVMQTNPSPRVSNASSPPWS
jgi:kynurenine formamidase